MRVFFYGLKIDLNVILTSFDDKDKKIKQTTMSRGPERLKLTSIHT